MEEISWESAWREVESRLGQVRARHGHDAVAIYAGNPTVHNLGAMLGIGQFIRAVRTKNLYSATSVDQLPHMVASWAMFGHQFLMPVPDVDRAQLFVCVGGNPVASAGSIMGAPGFERRIEALRARGGRFVVVDPRRTESAAIADEYLSIRPGTDVYLLLALLHEVFTSGCVRLGHLEPLVDGVEALRDAVLQFDASALAARTSIPAARIVALAHELLDEPRALVYGRVGACTQEFGGLTLWLIYCLNAVTGHLDREGGMMFAEPAVDLTRAYGAAGHMEMAFAGAQPAWSSATSCRSRRWPKRSRRRARGRSAHSSHLQAIRCCRRQTERDSTRRSRSWSSWWPSIST